MTENHRHCHICGGVTPDMNRKTCDGHSEEELLDHMFGPKLRPPRPLRPAPPGSSLDPHRPVELLKDRSTEDD